MSYISDLYGGYVADESAADRTEWDNSTREFVATQYISLFDRMVERANRLGRSAYSWFFGQSSVITPYIEKVLLPNMNERIKQAEEQLKPLKDKAKLFTDALGKIKKYSEESK